MRVFIAEKPSLAQAIAENLSPSPRRCNGYWDCGQDKVTWCFGHIFTQCDPEDYDPAWKSWRVLPVVPSAWRMKPKKDAETQIAVIGDLLRKADSVVHAGDPDREGQLLVDEVLEHFAYAGPVKRIWLASLDSRSVAKALAGLTDNAAYASLRDAARARSRADWLVGLNATRALTNLGRDSGIFEVLSLGRVQTPVLKLVVSRDRAIAAFKPIDYMVPEATFEHASGAVVARFVPGEMQDGLDDQGRLVKVSAVDAILDAVRGKTGSVTSVAQENRQKAQPKPYSLSTLQKAASARFDMTAQRVLDVAQSLYEKKLTTYPRSDCNFLPSEQFEDAARILGALARVPGLEAAAQGADPSLKSAAWDTSKVTAHHAIIPTGEMPGTLTDDERKLYELIAVGYIVQFYPVMRYTSQKVVLDVEGTVWQATGRHVVEPGWTRVTREADEEAEPEQSLPALARGDAVICKAVDVLKKKTSPPARWTEGTLIEAMANVHRFVDDADAKGILRENEGIGTEATRAGILETLKARKYLVNQGKALVSTRLAGQVIDAVPQALKDPVTTAQWESRLKAIADGTDSLDAFMADQTAMLPALLAPLLSGEIVIKMDGPVFPCPVCGKPLQKSSNERGPFWRCLRTDLHPDGKPVHLPDDRGRPGERRAPTLTEFACETCGKPLRHVTGEKNGRRYDFFTCSDKACGATFDNVDGKPVPRKVAQDSGFVCPDCGKPLRRQSRVSRRTGKAFTVYNCSGYPRCKASFFEKNGKPDFGN